MLVAQVVREMGAGNDNVCTVGAPDSTGSSTGASENTTTTAIAKDDDDDTHTALLIQRLRDHAARSETPVPEPPPLVNHTKRPMVIRLAAVQHYLNGLG